jgi:hypothetical protein
MHAPYIAQCQRGSSLASPQSRGCAHPVEFVRVSSYGIRARSRI